MAKDYIQYDGVKVYPIRTNPLDLRMQISTCENYMYHGWVEPWSYLNYVNDIVWFPSLHNLLKDEKFWGNLCYCEECAKYKPKEAFGKSEYEKTMEGGWMDLKEYLWRVHGLSIGSFCKRCRARAILIHVEKREEWRENQIEEDDQLSYGLRKVDWQKLITNDDPLRDRMTLYDYLEVVGGYETWEEVFEKLGL